MSPTAIALIVIAAAAHASWNLFSKQAATSGAAYFIWLFSAWITVGYAPVVAVAVILIHPRLTGLSWIFMVGTGVLQAAYFLFLQIGYSRGDLSVVYPVGRGTGAMLAAGGGIVVFGERPGVLTVAGILAIIAGVVLIGLPARSGPDVSTGRVGPTHAVARRIGKSMGGGPPHGYRVSRAGIAGANPGDPGPATAAQAGTPHAGTSQAATPHAGTPQAAGDGAKRIWPAIGYALATGVFIASYTLWDKYAVATLRTPAILQGYACFPVIVTAFAPLVLRDRGRLAEVWRSFRPQVLGAALLAPLAYILVLTALSFTAVSAVAPAREVSVLFGVLLGRRLLGEGQPVRRLTAAAAIVAGIIAIAVG